MIREIEAQDYWGEDAHGDKYSKKLRIELLSQLNNRLIQLEPESLTYLLKITNTKRPMNPLRDSLVVLVST